MIGAFSSPAAQAGDVESCLLVARARGASQPCRVCLAPILASPVPPVSSPQYETQFRATYRLAAGDRVRFISWSVPELSREMQVGADGTFVYPEVGTVQASGRTVVQLETELGQRLAADLGQLDPHVLDLRADLIDYGRSQVAVLGEVRMPGVYPWQPDTTPMALIAQTGGLTANAWFVALLIRAAPPQLPTQRYSVRAPGGAAGPATEICTSSSWVKGIPPCGLLVGIPSMCRQRVCTRYSDASKTRASIGYSARLRCWQALAQAGRPESLCGDQPAHGVALSGPHLHVWGGTVSAACGTLCP